MGGIWSRKWQPRRPLCRVMLPLFSCFHTPHSHAHYQKALPYPSLVLLHLILSSQIVLICNIGIYLRQPGGLK
ncbi:hypothetical protein NC653_032065 [Populus alba x Populus x berolinensis]|uniref:Uncharacterized protein n=1 Tax=Populus alba x Populus x berolinensis TaxID=444605 RepID=A0AAD6LQN8_9ROSI|nr:hypothetical protein NC653_032065 [Populus alba x Populus x berolinensis]